MQNIEIWLYVFPLLGLGLSCGQALGVEAIDIGSRLEPFVDDYLIGKMGGGAELRLHRPTEREVAIVHDAPWEGNAS